MDIQRVDRLISILDDISNTVDNKASAKLELDLCKRIVEKSSSFSSDCKECEQQFIEFENHIIQLIDKIDILEEDDVKNHKQTVANISSHLQNKHNMVTSGYYLSIYMSLGMSIGLMFGLLLFDNIALGLPIGMSIGLAIGVGLDEDAKKKGRTL